MLVSIFSVVHILQELGRVKESILGLVAEIAAPISVRPTKSARRNGRCHILKDRMTLMAVYFFFTLSLDSTEWNSLKTISFGVNGYGPSSKESRVPSII